MENNQENQFNVISGNGAATTGSINGTAGDFGTTTTTTNTFMFPTYSRELKSVDYIKNDEGNFIEITYVETPNQNFSYTYTVTWTVPEPKRRMVKERYGVIEGKLQLLKTIYGTEEPGYYVPPTVEWDEQ